MNKGIAVKGYELADAVTGKLLLRQKSNVIAVATSFAFERSFKVRCFRLDGKKRIYSEYSDILTILARP